MGRGIRGLLALVLLTGGWLVPGTGCAQGPTDAGVRGRVVDARGAAIGFADVEFRPAMAAGAEVSAGGRFAHTGKNGSFTILGLVPGVYRADVVLAGGMGRVGPVTLQLSAGDLAEWELRVGDGFPWVTLSASPLNGAADEGDGADGAVTVDVSQSATALSDHAAAADKGNNKATAGREAARVGAAEAEVLLGDLPVEGRQWEMVEELSAAGRDGTLAGGGSAQGDTQGEDDTAAARSDRETSSPAAGLSFGGLPVTENAQNVDGLSADQGFSGGPRGVGQGAGTRTSSGFSQGAVREVKVMPHTFSAQYGGAAGGVLAVSSRGGEPRLRGSAFTQVRQSGWEAVNPYAVVTRYNGGAVTSDLERPASSTVQAGLTGGLPVHLPGALRGWRSGVFVSVEEQVRSETLVSSPATVDFYRLTADQKALLGNRGVSTGATKAALEYLDNLTGAVAVRSPRLLAVGRFDTAPDEADRLSLVVQVQRQTAPATGGSGTSEGVINRAASSVGSRQVAVEAFTAQWHRTLSARMANSLRGQFAHEVQFETPAAPQAGVPATGPGGYAPQVSIQPEGFSYGTPASLGRVAYPDEQRMEAADSLAVRLGRHVLTIGGDWSRLHERVLAGTDLEGAFSYNNTTASGHDGGLVDWITDYTFNVNAYPNGGCPSVFATTHYFCFHSYTQGFTGAATEFVTHQIAGFAEDSVRLRRNLLLSAGVRYEYQLLPFPQQPNAALDTALRRFGVAGGGAAGAPVGAGVGSGSLAGGGVTSSFPEDRNNVGPRFSLAWSPGGGHRHSRWFTARLGYGAFYGQVPGATIDAALADTALPGSTSRIRITPKTETDCPQVANQGFGYPCAFLSVPTGVVAQTGAALVFAKRFRSPAVQRATLGLEKGLGRRFVLEAGYATAWATQLPESVDLNIAPSTGKATYMLQGGDGLPGLHTGEIFAVPQYTARLTTKYGPVTALMSNANATYHSGTAGAQLRNYHGWSARGSYTFARAIDYGPQSSATPRQDGQFDPFTNGYDKGLSDLQFAHHFSGDVSYQSGALAAGSREVRAALSGWHFAAIGVAGSGAPYSYGVYGGTRLTGGRESLNGSGGAVYLPTVGRNTLRLPPRGTVNLRSARELPLHGAMRLTLMADAFNLLNSVSVSRVETRGFLLGTPAQSGAPIPLVFQDAATIAAEGLNTSAFGTPLSSTSGVSRERQIELGARLNF